MLPMISSNKIFSTAETQDDTKQLDESCIELITAANTAISVLQSCCIVF